MRTEQRVIWRKSSYSPDKGPECVEAAALSADVGVRDSKDTGRGHLTLTPAAWDAFTRALK